MRTRKLGLGDRNIVGERVTRRRLELGLKQTELLARLQTHGTGCASCLSVLHESLKRATIPNRSSDFHSYFVLLSAGLYHALSKM